MKTKLLVALMTCLALGACSKTEKSSDENKPAPESVHSTTEGKPDAAPGSSSTTTTTTQPGAAPAGALDSPHSMADDHTTIAGDSDQRAPNQDPNQDPNAPNKVQDMNKDMSNANTQMQGDTPAAAAPGTDPKDPNQEAHTQHPED